MLVVYLTAAACANGGERAGGKVPAPSPPAAPAARADRAPLVIFLGDSLTAGYGLSSDLAFPNLLAAEMEKDGTPIRIVNAGVSGDTTSGALDRLDWLLAQKPDVLVVGLGANDAFRGQPVARIAANLRTIVEKSQRAGARVLILGMRVPTNFGPDYTKAFAGLYADVARQTHAALVPFLLDGVGGRPELNLDDGIHPNAEGQKITAGTVRPFLERVVKGR
jgi:acyl-CoA thioesterase I